jgi:hypothetical protein
MRIGFIFFTSFIIFFIGTIWVYNSYRMTKNLYENEINDLEYKESLRFWARIKLFRLISLIVGLILTFIATIIFTIYPPD